MIDSLAVIVPTLGRPALVKPLLRHLSRQTLLPDAVILSLPEGAGPVVDEEYPFPVLQVFARPGLTAQRNAALDFVDGRYDAIVFFDDDFIAADDYLFEVRRLFRQDDTLAVLTGKVIADGIKTKGFTFEEALGKLATDAAKPRGRPTIVDRSGAYGCNMAIRRAVVGTLRFDERLVLYGWLEDTDFTVQLRRRGRLVQANSLRGIHLGVKGGRISGLRFGYSQISNPVYLIRKGTIPPRHAVTLMARNILANGVRSLFPEAYIDRRGRLRGNLLALNHVLTGRIEPEYILEI